MSAKHKPKGKADEATHPPPAPPPEVVFSPTFPITWIPIGLCLETAEGDLNRQFLLELINRILNPKIDIVALDIQDLAEQEVCANSDLGTRLKAARQDYLEKRKKEIPQNWMSSTLLLELLNGKVDADCKLEHKKEDLRRKQALEESQYGLEGARTALNVAQEQLLVAERTVESYKKDLKKTADGTSSSSKLKEANLTIKATLTKAEKENLVSGKALKAGKEKEKTADQVKVGEDSLQKLEGLANEAERNLQDAENKLVAAMSIVKSNESALQEPYTLVRIYMLLSLGNDAVFVASLASGTENFFVAVLNLKIPRSGDVKENSNAPDSIKDMKVPKSEQVPILVTEMRALAKAAKLTDPVRQIAVIDIQCESPSTDFPKEAEISVLDEKKSGKKKEKEVGKSLPYDSMAKSTAALLKQLVQKLTVHKMIKQNVKYTAVPTAAPLKDMTARYYNQLLSEVPMALLSVPVILHCVIEQVVLSSSCASESRESHWEEKQKEIHDHLTKCFTKLGQKKPNAFPCAECSKKKPNLECKKMTGENEANEYLDVVHVFDKVGVISAYVSETAPRELQTMTALNVIEVEKHMSGLIPIPGKDRQGMPKDPILTKEERGILGTMIEEDGRFSNPTVQRYRKLMKLMELVKSEDTQEMDCIGNCISNIKDFQFIETFPNTVISEVYSKARLNHPFHKTIYDELEDCLLSVLYAAEGDFQCTYKIPCEVPFGNFCQSSEESKCLKVSSMAYSLEKFQSQITERKLFYLCEGGGLLSCGLPTLYANNDLQPTLYMDGNAYALRTFTRGNKSESELLASFEDGLILCFFLNQDHSVSLQILNPNGNVVEFGSEGVIYMYPAHVASEYKNLCSETGQEKCKTEQNECKNDIIQTGIPTALLATKKDEEIWRCILASGSVISGKRDGDLQILHRNGNVSDYKASQIGGQQWMTTNSNGYQVIQGSALNTESKLEKPRQPDSPEIELQKTESKSQDRKGKTLKDSKLKKDDTGEKMLIKGAPSKKIKNAPEEAGGNTDVSLVCNKEIKTSDESLQNLNLRSTRTGLEQIVSDDSTKPSLYLLPRKRVVHFVDPRTEWLIKSREDLVSVGQSPERESIVIHPDGTQIYTRPVVYQQSPLHAYDNITEQSICPKKGQVAVREDLGPQDKHISVGQMTEDDQIKPLVEDKGMPRTSNICNEDLSLSTEVHGKVDLNSMKVDDAFENIWQVIKESYPTVSSNGVELTADFSTGDNQYSVRYNKMTNELEFSMPNGCCLSTVGVSISLKSSKSKSNVSGIENPIAEVKALERWEQLYLQSGEDHDGNGSTFLFNLESGVVSHKDSTGNRIHIPHFFNLRPPKDQLSRTNPGNASEKQSQGNVDSASIRTSKSIPRCQENSENIGNIEERTLLDRGPTTRFFIFYEGCQGLEILGKSCFQSLLEESKNSNCSMHLSHNFGRSSSNTLLHSFIKRNKCQGNFFPSKDRPIYQKATICTNLEVNHHQTDRGRLSNNNLPQIFFSTTCKRTKRTRKDLLFYRHIREYSTLDEADHTEIENLLSKLTRQMLDIQPVNQDGETNLSGITKNRNTSGDYNLVEWQEVSRITETVKKELANFLQGTVNKGSNTGTERPCRKSSPTVCSHLPEKQVRPLGPWTPNKDKVLFYFSSEEGLKAFKEDLQQKQHNDVLCCIEELLCKMRLSL